MLTMMTSALALMITAAAVDHHGGMNKGEPMTRDAVAAKVAEHFAKIDADNDGFVTEAERKAMHEAHKAKKKEHMAKHMKGGSAEGGMFDKLDVNKDGTLSREEFAKMREMRKHHRMAKAGKRMMRMHHHKMMMKADADNDGRISLAEMQAQALSHFDMMDANKDGTVTPEERREMHKKMHDKMHAGHGEKTS